MSVLRNLSVYIYTSINMCMCVCVGVLWVQDILGNGPMYVCTNEPKDAQHSECLLHLAMQNQ